MSGTLKPTWWLIMLLSVAIAGYALFHVATGFAHVPSGVLDNANLKPIGIEVHITASAFAMLTGAFQFNRTLRNRAKTFHRWLGRIYVAACLVGGTAGGAIAMGSTAGPVAGAGFLGLAIFWVLFTLMAWISAMRKDFTSHERWMIRSFALTFAAVTLRLYLPLAGGLGAAGLIPSDFLWSYRIIAWACWVPNLIVAELFIATLRKPKRPAPAAAAA
jgi:uncharacterized membrane protein